MAIENSDYLVLQKGIAGELRKASVQALLEASPDKSINDLTDVDTSAVTDGQMLVYTTDTWVPQDIPSGVDLSNYLQKPGSEGDFVISEAADGTIRKEFAESKAKNAVHGSDSDENAEIEGAFFFSQFERF